MTITAAQVKELRDLTGAGMMDAKKALQENNGDKDAALDWLRQKGIAKAAKKADRVAAEGIVWAVSQGTKGAMVEVNSETDFAAKNNMLQEFVKTLSQLALDTGATDKDTLLNATYPGSDKAVAEKQTDLVATIGENISLRRVAYVEQAGGTVGSYVHMGGKIGALIAIAGAEGQDEVAKQVAMHVAASNPQFLNKESMDQGVLAREKAVYEAQAAESGKPANVVEKMVEGRMNKFAEENCLVEQPFIMDTDRKVGKVVSDAAAGATLAAAIRFGLGEGVEKKEEDFAAEVAKAVNS